MTTSTTPGPQRRASRATGRPVTVAATGSADAVLVALADRPGATPEQLAAVTGLGRSTVTKTLATLGAEHRVVRSPGGREQGRRLADRWSLPPVIPSPEPPGPAGDEPGGASLTGDRSAEGRLGRGELRSLVAERLAAEPTTEFTPTRLAWLLGHSAGAISNALTRMIADGLAVQTSASPRRYRHAPTGGPR